MANFIVTFQIKSDESYQRRYSSFVRRMNEVSNGDRWDETTSFNAFESDMTAEELCLALDAGSEFDSTKDIMVVIDLSTKRRVTAGPIKRPDDLEELVGF